MCLAMTDNYKFYPFTNIRGIFSGYGVVTIDYVTSKLKIRQ